MISQDFLLALMSIAHVMSPSLNVVHLLAEAFVHSHVISSEWRLFQFFAILGYTFIVI